MFFVPYFLYSLAPWSGSDCYHEQLKRNSKFLCLDQRMHTELVGRIVLQLNRTYPQILTDKEALRVSSLVSMLTL